MSFVPVASTRRSPKTGSMSGFTAFQRSAQSARSADADFRTTTTAAGARFASASFRRQARTHAVSGCPLVVLKREISTRRTIGMTVRPLSRPPPDATLHASFVCRAGRRQCEVPGIPLQHRTICVCSIQSERIMVFEPFHTSALKCAVQACIAGCIDEFVTGRPVDPGNALTPMRDFDLMAIAAAPVSAGKPSPKRAAAAERGVVRPARW